MIELKNARLNIEISTTYLCICWYKKTCIIQYARYEYKDTEYAVIWESRWV